MRILIYGAGVIGSLYAALFAEAGYDTNIYARGKRLEALRNNGLKSCHKTDIFSRIRMKPPDKRVAFFVSFNCNFLQINFDLLMLVNR